MLKGAECNRKEKAGAGARRVTKQEQRETAGARNH